MSDLARRLGFGGPRPASRDAARRRDDSSGLLETEAESTTASATTDVPGSERPSFTSPPFSPERTPVAAPPPPPPPGPSLSSRDAKIAAMQAMAAGDPCSRWRDDAREAMPPPPLRKARTIHSGESITGPPGTPTGGGTLRISRSRGLAKMSSYLSLRSEPAGTDNNSSSAASKRRREHLDGDGRSKTPLPSPRDTPLISPWFDKGWRDSARPTNKLSGHERDKYVATAEHGTQSGSTAGYQTPSLAPTASCASSSRTAAEEASQCGTPISATMPPHDWKQWDQKHDRGPSFFINEADLTWHRPSFRQIVESLRVAIVSGESVAPVPEQKAARPYPASQLQQPSSPPMPSSSSSPSTASLLRWRPSAAPAPSLATTGPEHPIPGRYRGHIMRAIEGIHDIQHALDCAELRAREAEDARKRDLAQFADLSEEWAVWERQLRSEIEALRATRGLKLHAQGAATLQHCEGGAASHLMSTPAVSPSPDSFLARVKAVIQGSSRTAKDGMHPDEEQPAPGHPPPALVCDLDHDKTVSDRIARGLPPVPMQRGSKRQWHERRPNLHIQTPADSASAAPQQVAEDSEAQDSTPAPSAPLVSSSSSSSSDEDANLIAY